MAPTATLQLEVTSPAFTYEQIIPAKYTCDGDGVNPPLQIHNIPDNTHSMALIVEDPDAPKGTYDHWIVWNIRPTNAIRENSNPGISGNNSAGKTGYHPPCPPSGSHRYYFHIYALDTRLNLEAGATKDMLHQAMKPHILAKATIIGRYEKQTKQ